MEYLEIVDENNNFTWEILERNFVHENWLFHREIAVLLVNEKWEILLQKRAWTKKQEPNKWALCAGHIDIWEKELDATIREIGEEIWIKFWENEIEFLFTYKLEIDFWNNWFNNHFKYFYFVKTDKKIEDFRIDLDEVSELKYISFQEFEKKLRNRDEEIAFSNLPFVWRMLEELKNKIN